MVELRERTVTPVRMATRVLMLVDADAAADRERSARRAGPRRDYRLLAEALDADIYDAGSVKTGRAGRLLAKLAGKGPSHAIASAGQFKQYDLVFSDNEYSGLFAALLMRCMAPRPRHVVLAHHLTPAKKRLIARLARGGIDRLILHSTAQRRFAIERLGFDPDRIEVVPYQVDTSYWRPQPGIATEGYVATAGLECRDYRTLIEAMGGLGLDLQVAAASNWSRKKNTLRDVALPAGVHVNSYDYRGLRDLYARSRFVVVPLLEVDFQAGITTVLEGMAMGKAVISTATSGHQKAFEGPLWQAGMTEWPSSYPSRHDASGIYVPPSDPVALHAAMRYLREHPEQAEVIGANARRRVEDGFTVEQFAERMAGVILGA